MSDTHFLSGISQIAIGADQAFSLACQDLGIPQRISLPQPSDAYLAASGSSGPDFTDDQKLETEKLLASPHIIQETVAASTASRHLRFEETNIELVRQSDVIIAMVKNGDDSKRGGTHDVILQAKRRNIPVLVVTFDLVAGQPGFKPEWEGGSSPAESGHHLPALPPVLESFPFNNPRPGKHQIPPKDAYFDSIKTHCSHEADRFSKFFQNSALIIIGTHTAATACAVLALVLTAGLFYPVLAVLLALEIFLLIFGFFRHHILHTQGAASRWAMNRLLSEVARSVIAFGRYHVGFGHLKPLNLPDRLAPLLRTMETLQLRESRLDTCDDWSGCRDAYVSNRLTKKNGQLDFYRRKAHEAETRHHLAHKVFTIASSIAILASVAKLVVVVYLLLQCHHEGSHLVSDVLKAVLGFFGVLLPIVAVAALSFAAAHDLEARAHTFSEMLGFLTNQTELLNEVTTEHEFARLLAETEARLLGETVTWYSRRSFTGVA